MKRALFPVVCILVLGAVAQAQNVQFKIRQSSQSRMATLTSSS
jgi:hypothetical protein